MSFSENQYQLTLKILKDKLGIRSDVRDEYLLYRIKAIVNELEEEKGIQLDGENPDHFMFVVDYAYLKYVEADPNRDEHNLQHLRRTIQWKLHNMMIHKSGTDGDGGGNI